MFILVVLVDLHQLLILNILWGALVLPLVVAKLYKEVVQVLAFEVDWQSVPMAVQTVVVEVLYSFCVIFLGMG